MEVATPRNGPPAPRISRIGLWFVDTEALTVAKMVAMVEYCMSVS